MTNLVLTPGGYKPDTLVHRVPTDALVQMRGNVAHLVRPDGQMLATIGEIAPKLDATPLMPNNLSRLLPDRTLDMTPAAPPRFFAASFAGGPLTTATATNEASGGGIGGLAGRIASAAGASSTTTEKLRGGIAGLTDKFATVTDAVRDAAVHALTPDPDASRTVPFASIDGWVAYGGWTNNAGQPISRFATTWVVPPEPVNKGNQTIFLFNGIQNSTMIYQPVLQWGPSAAGGGKKWSVASWYADGQTGHSFHTDLVDVHVGDTLVGIMTLTGQANGLFNYNCEFHGIANTALPISQVQQLTWANETLEAYRVTGCNDYPATSKTRFGSIAMQCGTATPTIGWTANSPHTDCGAHASIVSNSASSGTVDIWYRSEIGMGGWEARHGLSAADYQATFDDLVNNQGMQLVCVSGYDEGGQAHYAAIWRKVASPPAWQARHGLTAQQHQQLFTDLPAQGYHPVLVNGYTVGGRDLYASIWEKGSVQWAARHGLSGADYQHAFDDLTHQGFAPVWVSGYGSGDPHYAAVFHKPAPVAQWTARHGLSAADYQATFNTLNAQGFRPKVVSGYGTGQGDRYAAIFVKPPSGPAWQARHNLSAAQYQQLFTDLPKQHLHPVGVNGYTVGGQVRFTALWEG